ncbi:MAG: RluA family pseudouridine synthase [bacterium]|nr:RluA family pseudouridine synthase [bacterium]
MSDEHLVRSVPAGLAGERLDRVLDALVEGRTRAALQKLVRKGGVRLDGKKVLRSNVRVRAGQKLSIQGAPRRRAAPPRPEVAILHEDAAIVVVDKPAGVPMHLADRVSGTTLVSLVEDAVGPLPAPDAPERAGVVHRLDRETSGVVVFGRTTTAMRALQDQFRARTVRKRYLALVLGAPREERWEVDLPLGPAPGQVDRQMARPPEGGKEALTAFELLESMPRASLLACHPRTGRRHQIRVHLLACALQLVGDRIYRVRPAVALPEGIAAPKRHALHANRLAFAHPTSGAALGFESPLPADLEALVKVLR